MEQTKPKSDPLFRLKYIGFSWSNLAPGETTMEDFVNFCKFILCAKTHRLMKDPIWDEYRQEEIIAEFFAHKFHGDKDAVREFELQLAKGEILDFDAWADLQIKKDEEEKQEKIQKEADRISFSPDDVMGDK
jgi:hypothetical protein